MLLRKKWKEWGNEMNRSSKSCYRGDFVRALMKKPAENGVRTAGL